MLCIIYRYIFYLNFIKIVFNCYYLFFLNEKLSFSEIGVYLFIVFLYGKYFGMERKEDFFVF